MHRFASKPPLNARPRVATALAAGVIGTLALELFERGERKWLGREPVYAPRRIAQRLGRAGTGKAVAKRRGDALRWIYGPALGAVLGARHARRGVAAAGLLVGCTICGFELVAAPSVHATPPLRAWPKVELALLLAHATVFGIVTVATFRLLRRR